MGGNSLCCSTLRSRDLSRLHALGSEPAALFLSVLCSHLGARSPRLTLSASCAEPLWAALPWPARPQGDSPASPFSRYQAGKGWSGHPSQGSSGRQAWRGFLSSWSCSSYPSLAMETHQKGLPSTMPCTVRRLAGCWPRETSHLFILHTGHVPSLSPLDLWGHRRGKLPGFPSWRAYDQPERE